MASQFVKTVNGFPTIKIGAMRHLITIEQAVISGTYDHSGVAQTGRTTVATCMAAIGTSGVKRPDDVVRGGQTGSQLFVEVVTFYNNCPTLEPDMYVVSDNGSTYIVQTVENVDELNVVWIMRCIALGQNT